MTRPEAPMDELIRELEELAELASDALRDDGRTDAIRRSYAHAARLAREAKGISGCLKSADEYAELVRFALRELDEDDLDGQNDGWLKAAQVHATLALAAATLEAARLVGPTPEDQARLDALGPRTGHVCTSSCDHLGIDE